jgi:hypothetical protein
MMKTRLLIAQFAALMVCGLVGPKDSNNNQGSSKSGLCIAPIVRTSALSKDELGLIKDLEKQSQDTKTSYMHLHVAWFVLSAVLLPLTLFTIYSLGQQYLKTA